MTRRKASGSGESDAMVEAAVDELVVRSVRLRRSTLERIGALTQARGLRPTELIRDWIEERLEVEELPETTAWRLELVIQMASLLQQAAAVAGLKIEVRLSDPLVTSSGEDAQAQYDADPDLRAVIARAIDSPTMTRPRRTTS